MLSVSTRLCASLSTIATNYRSVVGHINFNFKSLIMTANSANINRFLATLNERAVAQSQWLVTLDEAQEFLSFFPEIIGDLTVRNSFDDIPEGIERFANFVEYNVPRGNNHRGLRALSAYKAFESAEKLTSENIRLASILGWCAELLQASLVVQYDIENSSKLRRGTPCWHAIEGVGLGAIYDFQMLENTFYSLLKMHFSHLDCYIPIIEMYHEMLMKTRIGHSLNFMCHVDGKPQFNYFTMQVFNTIAKYKTTYQEFHVPIITAMYLAGKNDPALVEQVEDVLQGLGQFYQIEDDILECFGDELQMEKDGTNITQGKCTWLAVMALQRATPAQRKVFQENYGRPEAECEAAVRNLYNEMGLLDVYLLYKKNGFNRIRASIDRMSDDLPKEYFYKYVKHLYKEDY